MEKIKETINQYISIEKQAEEAIRRSDIETYNNLIDRIFELSGPNVKLANKIALPITAAQEDLVGKNKDIAVRSRHFYKISEYVYPKYNKIWICILQ
jgi:hypothetical protein